MKHKRIMIYPLLLGSVISLTSCSFMDLFTGDTDTIHTSSYEPITGKFVLYDALDEREDIKDAYFDISGSKDDFTIKYYENGALKKDGIFQKIITRKEKIGKFQDNLHFNIKCGNSYEHISAYTESLDPINQFRIIEEYNGSDDKYYLSELPFIMGTYVREGETYKKETLVSSEKSYLEANVDCFTSALNGYYKLDDEHYFYFVFPKINSFYAFAYFQYYSPSLAKPLEGFAQGRTHKEVDQRTGLYLTYSREVLFDKVYKDTKNNLVFGYHTFDDNDRMIDHWGSVDFSNGNMNSFSFEHLSREWTDAEWDLFTKDESYHMPDPVNYDYMGGTYTKSN